MTVPVTRAAPIQQWQVAVGAPGQVAVGYLVTRPTPGYDGYVVGTRNALDSRPIFFGARINPASRPIVTQFFAGDDFISVDIGPDGTPWAAFYADCPPDGSDRTCTAAKESTIPQGNGEAGWQAMVVAHLHWPL
jgi:hypothetical protein